MLNCDQICLLAAAVAFSKGPTSSVCNYCVDVRSTNPTCFENIIECAYKDPASLIFCLNVYEKSDSIVDHSLRCISYKQFFISDEDIINLGDNGICNYNDGAKCNCSVCPYVEEPVTPNNTDIYDDVIVSTQQADEPHRQRFRGRAKHHGYHEYDHHDQHHLLSNRSYFERKEPNGSVPALHSNHGLIVLTVLTQLFVTFLFKFF